MLSENIIAYIKQQINENEFQKRHKSSIYCFTHQKCEVNFEKTMLFVLGNNKGTLATETINFSHHTGTNFDKSALSKARTKINHSAFVELFQKTADLMPVNKTYCGYQLTAYDGTHVELPQTAKLDKYAQKTDNNLPEAHIVASYDVLNKHFIDATVDTFPANERELARLLAARNTSEIKQIALLDRGFPSLFLIKDFIDRDEKFIFRVSSSFIREINEFYKSSLIDETLSINYDKRRLQTSEVKSIEDVFAFSIRCAKIILSSGEKEVLITNLPQTEFSIEQLYELYHLRWEIETAFNFIKNTVEIEKFTSLHENSILQEIYTSFLQYNLSLILYNAAEELYKKN